MIHAWSALAVLLALFVSISHGERTATQHSLFAHSQQVGELPTPPRLLTVASITRNTALVSWGMPLRHGTNVTEYRLQMATFPENSDAKTHRFTNADFVGKCRIGMVNCTVFDLTPGTKYRFRVRGGINGAFGPYSAPLDFDFPTIPPPPSNPTSSEATESTITIAWEPPIWPNSVHHTNGSDISAEKLAPVIGYEVETGIGPASELKPTFKEASNQTVQVLSNLQPGSLYRFRVRGWNVIGFSEWSDIAAAFTNTNIPGAPSNITFSDILIDGCTVSWLGGVENGGRVNRYDLLMVEENGKKLDPPRLAYEGGGGTLQATLKDLHPGWKYSFRVRAHNGNGAGPVSEKAQVRMLDPVPNRPPPPTVSKVRPTELQVDFGPAAESSGAVIATYELSVAQERPGSNLVTAFTSAYEGARRTYLLKHLTVGGCYRFRVRAMSDTGTASKWSHDGRSCTLATPPTSPLPPHGVNITETSLTVRWSPPADHGAAISQYHLEMMGPAQNPTNSGTARKHPLSVGGRFTRVYSGPLLSFDALTLLPDTVYIFRVIAENAMGQSLPSNTSTARTLPLLPVTPPAPTLVSRESSMLAVMFLPGLPSEHHTLPVEAMELQAAEGSSDDASPVALWRDVYDGDERSFTLRGLLPDASYRFRCRSRNSRGVSQWGPVFSATTAAAAPSPITDLFIVEKDPFHVVVSWNPPKDNGQPILNYHVEVARSEHEIVRHVGSAEVPSLGKWRTVQKGKLTNVTLMDNLHIQRGSFFAVRVRCSNAAGDSLFSAPIHGWARPGDDGLPFPPDQVLSPRLTQISATGARVSWDRPDNNGGPIVRFVVEVAEVDNNMCERHPVLGQNLLADCSLMTLSPGLVSTLSFEKGCETLSDPDKKLPATTSCQLDDLEAGAKYAVRIKASNFVGESESSASTLLVLFETGHGTPPTPDAPFVAHADTTSVLVRWSGDTVLDSGTSDHISAFDVGMSSVPQERLHQMIKLDNELKAVRRAEQSKNSTYLAKARSQEVILADMLSLVVDLDTSHVHRGETNEDSLWYRAEDLNAGGAYAFRVRAVDGDTVGDWSEPALVTLSPDVPLPEQQPELVNATSDSLTIRVFPSHPQGSPLVSTTVEMAVVTDVAAGTWSRPAPLIKLDSESPANGTSWVILVTELPPNTPFGFRVSSSNEVGEGDFGDMAHFFTQPAPLAKPLPPQVKGTEPRSIAVRMSLPVRGDKRRSVVVPTSPLPPVTQPDKKFNPDLYAVSGTDFLFTTHQQLDESASKSLQTRYQLLVNIGPSRSYTTVCNVTSPGCVVENLRPYTQYRLMARVIEPWGASDWSEPTTTMTERAQPDAPTFVSVGVEEGTQTGHVQWSPPESNGYPILGFEVIGAKIPERAVKYTSSVVSTRMAPSRFLASATEGMEPYFVAGRLRETDGPKEPKPTEEEDDIDLAKSVELIPNPFSPEAVVASKPLPPAPPIPSDSDPEDVSEDNDPLLPFLSTIAANTTSLSFDWKLASNETSSLFAVRVRAFNKRGKGPFSPIYRFFSSTSSAALAPNQPAEPTLSRSSSNSLQLEWQAPYHNGAAVSLYAVRMHVGDLPRKGEPLFHDVYVGSNQEVTIDKLVPNKTYYFYLIAHNSVGTSPPSNLVSFNTPPS